MTSTNLVLMLDKFGLAPISLVVIGTFTAVKVFPSDVPVLNDVAFNDELDSFPVSLSEDDDIANASSLSSVSCDCSRTDSSDPWGLWGLTRILTGQGSAY
jgi:hypothetical protein